MGCQYILVIALGLSILFATAAPAQSSLMLAEHQAYQNELLQTYRKLKAAPEERALLSALKSLPFFPYDSTFRVLANLDTTAAAGFLPMKTSHGRSALYRRYGYLRFSFGGHSFRMPVYQAKSAASSGSDELFFPFTDNT